MKNLSWHRFASLKGNPYIVDVDLNKFHCLLIHLTKASDYSKNDYPIALGYMASLLRMNGGSATIKVLDINQKTLDIDYSAYDLICIFPMSVLFKQLLAITVIIKRQNPKIPICLFNSEQHQHEMMLCTPDALNFAQTIMKKYLSIDFILIGDAEYSFLSLCKNLYTGQNCFNEIPSCLYRKFGKISFSQKKTPFIDFNFLPFPARDSLKHSISKTGINRSAPRIQSSRGCVAPCLYCVESTSNRILGGKKQIWNGRDIIRFVDEIEMLSKKYGVCFFNIIDSSFEDPGKKGLNRLNIFCREIFDRGIKVSFKAHFRIDTFRNLNDEALNQLKEAGVDILVIGAESGVERELKSYKKKTTVAENLSTINRLHDFKKFFILLGHMAFSPCLELSDLPKKVQFLLRIHNGWDYLNMSNNLIIFRGTAYHKFIKKIGLSIETDILSPVIPYRYYDDRIEIVAREMGNLKKKCPDVITLHNLLYDGLNIQARFSNKMNSHLWGKYELFNEFASQFNELLQKVEAIYCGYFSELIELAKNNATTQTIDTAFHNWIPIQLPILTKHAICLLHSFINDLTKQGECVEKLYLKTWMSLINTETNTSKGKVIPE